MKNFKILILCLLILSAFVITGCGTDYYSLPESPAGDFTFKDDTLTNGIVVTEYHGAEETVVIPSEFKGKAVTRVMMAAFEKSKTIKTLVIPQGTKVISAGYNGYAMSGADSTLETVILPEGLEVVEPFSFRNLKNLKNISLPESLQSIGRNAFENCQALTEIQLLPVLFTSKDNSGLFMGSGLTKAEIPEGITEIPMDMFAYSQITEIEFPDSLRKIGTGAFKSCPIESLTLPEGIEKINPRAFYGTKLREATVPSTVTEFYHNSFGGDGFEKLTVLCDAPESFGAGIQLPEPAIELYEIHYEESVKGYTFPRWNGYPTRIQGSDIQPNLHEGFEYTEIEGGVEITAYLGSDIDVVVPESINGKPVISIGKGAFESRKDIFTLSLPNTVQTIGENAFRRCESLSKADFQTGLKTIGNGAFSFCGSLDSVDMPEGLEEIGDYAFAMCKRLETVTLPNGLEIIGNGAFGGTAVSELIIPASVKTIYSNLFDNMAKPTLIYFEGTAPKVLESERFTEENDFVIFYREGASGFDTEFWEKAENKIW